MSEAVRPPMEELIRRIAQLERQVEELRRTPSGRNSIGILQLRPATKAGTPVDADFAATGVPPLGAIVYDTTGSRIWVRHAAGVWRSVIVA